MRPARPSTWSTTKRCVAGVIWPTTWRTRALGIAAARPLPGGQGGGGDRPSPQPRNLRGEKGELPSLLVPCRFEARFKRLATATERHASSWDGVRDGPYREGLDRTYGATDLRSGRVSSESVPWSSDEAAIPTTAATR